MSINFNVELRDTRQQRIAVFSDVISLEATRHVPDQLDTLRCVLPHVEGFGPGCTVDLSIDNKRWQRYTVTHTQFCWDADFQPEYNTRTPLRDLMRVEAQTAQLEGNTRIRRVYADITLEEAFLDIINCAPGPLHYLVDHGIYPDGARREYTKLLERISADNELGINTISQGQWVGADRIDTDECYAKDGDTLSGLKVDGIPWPDLRLMMIDTEEPVLNSHARKRHLETALWSTERYKNSGYKLLAVRAQQALQSLLDSKGISHIELNPHRDRHGSFDDRVDAYGRYIGRVFGGEECFCAALVEQGLSEVYLYKEGLYHVPEHRLKDFFSYPGVSVKSYPALGEKIHALDLNCGALEALTLLAYLCGNQAFLLTPELEVTFKNAAAFDYNYRYCANEMAITSGFTSKGMINRFTITGNAIVAPGQVSGSCEESITAYGLCTSAINGEWIGDDVDKEHLAAGLIRDLAYPAPAVAITFFEGAPELFPGALVSVSNAPLARYARRLSEEWGNEFDETIAGRVMEVKHLLRGKDARTEVILSAPLRSVKDPLSLLRRIRTEREPLFAIRLDERPAGLDREIFYLA
ncbi:MAG: hypothetical protein KAH38_08875 [Candidatus Hydrogenedentes bacterium]|nr:hypothetical protein [Candidatus Hydrogenedentota bacterium]